MNYQDLLERSRAEDLSAARLRAVVAARLQHAAAMPIRERLAGFRRAWPWLLLWTLLCAGLGLLYCLQATPKFLVSTEVVLEPRQPTAPIEGVGSSMAPTLDSALADSQVQVLTSERNLRYVFEVQNLDSDPEFNPSGFNPVAWLLARTPFADHETVSADEQAKRQHEIAFANFAGRVSVRRVAQSYALQLFFLGDSPAKATRLANAITTAYIRDKVLYNTAAAAAQRGNDFLQNRVADIKAEVDAANNAVKTGVIPDFVFGHADARIIGSALEPLKKSYPRTTLIVALAAAFGLLSGGAVVFLSGELDRRVRSAARFWAATGIAATAELPQVRRYRNLKALLRIASTTSSSAFAEGIRRLRIAALTHAEPGKSPKFGVISFRRGEGASVVAANFASVLAEAGMPVALVDGDIYHPTQTTVFAPQTTRGFAEVAAGRGDENSRILLTEVAPNMSLLPARSLRAAPDPNQLVGFQSTSVVCETLSRSKIVVVDLPAVSDSPEGAAVARDLTGVFLVVDAQTTTFEQFAELLDRLSESDARVLGIALNRVKRT